MRRALAATLLLLASLMQAHAATTQQFVDAFTAACVPQRLSFEGTKSQAAAEGWQPVEVTDTPELHALMERAVTSIRAETDYEITFAFQTYRRDVAGSPHYLVVTHFDSGPIEGLDDPFIENGCYLYDFDATQPPDPAPVTAFIGKPVSNSEVTPDIVGYLWGPPCALPFTGDTYLTYVPDGSGYIANTAFSGLMMKFSTAEPDPGEVVPETFCVDEPTQPAQ